MVWANLPLDAQEATWIFEGVATEADPRLAPALKSGWVLSGSFLLDPLEMEEAAGLETDRSGRLSNGLSEAELTVDLYHQVKFQGLQVPGMAGFDYQNDDPDEDGRDLIGWFIPMRGKVKDTDWSIRWLQIWLLDVEGRMIRTTPPPIPPSGFPWKSSWFRLGFVNSDGEEAFMEGTLEFFVPEAALSEKEEDDLWESVVAGLSRELIDRDARIELLSNELEEARQRLESVRRMVDLLVEERESLQREKDRLEERVQPENSSLDNKLTQLTAEKAIAEESLVELQERNLALAETLGHSERERRRLQGELGDLRAAMNAPGPTPEVIVEEVLGSEGAPAGTITVFERPMVIEKPVAVPSTGEVQTERPSTSSQKAPERRSRFGPRKFR